MRKGEEKNCCWKPRGGGAPTTASTKYPPLLFLPFALWYMKSDLPFCLDPCWMTLIKCVGFFFYIVSFSYKQKPVLIAPCHPTSQFPAQPLQRLLLTTVLPSVSLCLNKSLLPVFPVLAAPNYNNCSSLSTQLCFFWLNCLLTIHLLHQLPSPLILLAQFTFSTSTGFFISYLVSRIQQAANTEGHRVKQL